MDELRENDIPRAADRIGQARDRVTDAVGPESGLQSETDSSDVPETESSLADDTPQDDSDNTVNDTGDSGNSGNDADDDEDRGSEARERANEIRENARN